MNFRQFYANHNKNNNF